MTIKNFKQMEYITFEELYAAYVDCRRHKRKTEACSKFEMELFSNLQELLDDLNNKTYTLSPSICFVVTRPKIREVFAADFRDRIVHHLVIGKFIDLFENHFIPSTYNCRKGKGVFYGVYDLKEKIDKVTEGGKEEAWIWKADLKNFFMSIEKQHLFLVLRSFLRSKYKGPDLEWWLWLIELIVMNEPQSGCIVRGNSKLLNSLPPEKRLRPGYGLAIGNLPSQIFANFFLSLLDYLLYYWTGIEYGRYVDDFYCLSKDKELLLYLMSYVRNYLKEWLGIELHPKKWLLQEARKGIKFTGYVIKSGRIYTGSRTVDSAFMVAEYGSQSEKYTDRLNSYLGFLSHTQSYAIRRNLWDVVKQKGNYSHNETYTIIKAI